MSGLPLPLFGGSLRESWDLHEIQLVAWLRTNNVEEIDDRTRIDFLLLSLKSNSNPLIWFSSQPAELKHSFLCCINLLKSKYGTDLRREMLRLSSVNNLEVRSFRDSEHKTEMVSDLVNDIDCLLSLASINDDSLRRDYLLKSFRSFNGALKMMNRAGSYDATILAVLNWESTVISKSTSAMKPNQMSSKPPDRDPIATTQEDSKFLLQKPAEASLKQHKAPRFLTQDLQPNPNRTPIESEVYYKTNLKPSQSRNPSPNQDNSSEPYSNSQCYAKNTNLTCQDDSLSQKKILKFPKPQRDFPSQSIPRPPVEEPLVLRKYSDPEYMMESAVDPQLMPAAPLHPPEGIFSSAGFKGNKYSQEVLNDLAWNPQQSSRSKTVMKHPFKPLVYDPKKNPYPPPENIEHPQKIMNDSNEMRPAETVERNGKFAPQGVIPPQVRVSNWLNSPSNVHMAVGGKPVYSDNSASIPFPSSQFPANNPTSAPLNHPKTRAPPEISSFGELPRLTPTATQAANIDVSFAFPTAVPQGPADNTGPSPNKTKRQSKLVKVRRRGSQSSNISSSDQQSFRSINRIKSFVGSLRRASSRGSQSVAESDSTQERGPNTPSTMEPGGTGCGFESEGHGKLRPMQAQFKRLFRKHQHPENVRRHQRSMLVNKSLPPEEQPLKGKARRLHFGSSRPEETTTSMPPESAILGMKPDDEIFQAMNFNDRKPAR
ncbi:hypothetical protein BY996DRAFT_4581726 [Phakopsora pachyrhizi]|nr:hypothetical protein BY996DRAFT_4581726 [Phakopsora pachyrhizi]